LIDCLQNVRRWRMLVRSPRVFSRFGLRGPQMQGSETVISDVDETTGLSVLWPLTSQGQVVYTVAAAEAAVRRVWCPEAFSRGLESTPAAVSVWLW